MQVERVHVSFGPQTALAGADVDLRPGEIVAVMGRNGSGKTTLLRTIAGLQRPSTGRVVVGGRAPRPGFDVALCPQVPEAVLFKETVTDEVRATLRAHGRDVSPEDLLERLGLLELAHAHPRDLSAGQRLLVATAAVAAAGAPVLLLDEPTRGLDPESKVRLGRMLRTYASDGRCVAFATHDVELAAELAQRVVMLAAGEVISDGSPRRVLGDSTVFAPQTARVFRNGWLTPDEVAAHLEGARA